MCHVVNLLGVHLTQNLQHDKKNVYLHPPSKFKFYNMTLKVKGGIFTQFLTKLLRFYTTLCPTKCMCSCVRNDQVCDRYSKKTLVHTNNFKIVFLFLGIEHFVMFIQQIQFLYPIGVKVLVLGCSPK